MDLVHETTAPLAWDHEQMPFQLPPEAIAWKVRLFTSRPGRPPAVYGEHGVLHLGLDATVEDLRRAVKGKRGHYRLYPVDGAGNELSPIGCMEIAADDEPIEPEIVQPGDATAVTREVLKLCTQMVASRDAHDQLISSVLTTLVTTTATIQRSTAALLGAANSTIQVANGVEALERQEPPQLDTSSVAEQLAAMLTPDKADESKPQPPWFVQLLTGPVGMGLMNLANNYAQALARAHAAAEAQQQAQAQQTASEQAEFYAETEAETDPEPMPRPRNASGMSRRERKRAEKAARAALKRQARAARPAQAPERQRGEIPDVDRADDSGDLDPDDGSGSGSA